MGDRQCLRMPIAQPPRISKLPIVPLVAEPHAARIVIEGAWGAAFHWIAFGCETKHHVHQESHARLGTFLRRHGEGAVAEWWEEIDRIRKGGWYGKSPEPERV